MIFDNLHVNYGPCMPIRLLRAVAYAYSNYELMLTFIPLTTYVDPHSNFDLC